MVNIKSTSALCKNARMTIEAVSPLLIGQYVNSPKLRAVADLLVKALNQEIEDPIDTLNRMRSLKTATGYWLDAIGDRFGLPRPYTSEGQNDKRIGFEGASDVAALDNAPFSGSAVNDAVFPLPDVVYRAFIRARARSLFVKGNIAGFRAAAQEIDPNITVEDKWNMTIQVVTNKRWQIELAVQVGAIPKPAGVGVRYTDRARLGFKGTGQPLDRGLFEVA